MLKPAYCAGRLRGGDTPPRSAAKYRRTDALKRTTQDSSRNCPIDPRSASYTISQRDVIGSLRMSLQAHQGVSSAATHKQEMCSVREEGEVRRLKTQLFQAKEATAHTFKAQRLRTPVPVEGRHHIQLQTDPHLIELTEKTHESMAETQTEPWIDRPDTPMFRPHKEETHASTQIQDGDLFDFDEEVVPILEVIVGKVLEQSFCEVMEEEELAAIREKQEEFERIRTQEVIEYQRLAAAEKRRKEETGAVSVEFWPALMNQISSKVSQRNNFTAFSVLALLPAFDRPQREKERAIVSEMASKERRNLDIRLEQMRLKAEVKARLSREEAERQEMEHADTLEEERNFELVEAERLAQAEEASGAEQPTGAQESLVVSDNEDTAAVGADKEDVSGTTDNEASDVAELQD